ncbi:hypothetical protein M6B38_358435 [Iris pallida]|uniref:Uncharacterized protein n=1 Tax=Iris pallida TaxID=29817 RepID=A0AAX6GKV9_IRIPA|nr:hypothetical protein M6B38_358435 [Iris pallida]
MPVCWSELDDRAEALATPSSPRSPFPKIHLESSKPTLIQRGSAGPVALRYWRFQRRSSRLSRPANGFKTFRFEAGEDTLFFSKGER